MRIATHGFNDKNLYEELNKTAEGHLYQMLEELGNAPLPAYFDRYGEGQRMRLGQSRVAETFKWSQVKAKRGPVNDSPLGKHIVNFLETVEQVDGLQQANNLSNVIPEKMGAIVAKVMNRQLADQQLQARVPETSLSPAPSTDIT